MRGLPDWGQPVDAGGVTGYIGHDTGRVLVLPDALVLATGPHGPEFRLSAVRPMVPTPTQRGHGRLEMTLALHSGSATADGRVQAVPALRGWLWLRAQALDLPEELRAPLELRCSGIGAADLSLTLRPEGLGFVERALSEGAFPVLAHAGLEVAGIARRVVGRVTVDHGALRAALARSMAPDQLRAETLRDAAALGLRIESDDPFAAEAAADHIRARLCDGPLQPGADGLVLVWNAALPPQGQTVLDLSQRVIATRVVGVQLDPFAEARRLAGPVPLIHRVTTAPLQAGQHRLSLSANLPRPLVGPLSVGARLVCPPRLPQRMHEVREDVEFPSGDTVDRVIRLSPAEPLVWRIEATAWLPTPDGRGAVLQAGPVVEGVGPVVDLGPQHFPLHFSRIAAGDSLLALGAVDLVLTAEGLSARARLTVDSPEVALALPGEGQLAARIVAPDGRVIDLAPRPAEDWRIELVDVPGFGARETEITVGFPPGLLLRAMDLRQGDGPVQTLAFTPARPTRRYPWFCADPFHAGFHWRWHDSDADFTAFAGDALHLDARKGEAA